MDLQTSTPTPDGPPPGAIGVPISSGDLTGPPPGATATAIAAPAAAPPPAAPAGWTRIKSAAQSVGDTLDDVMAGPTKGLVKGGMHTVAGLLNMFGSGRQSVMDAQQQDNVKRGVETPEQAQAVPKNAIAQHTKDAADWLNAHAQDHGIWQHIGDFGESALELMTPEALAGLGGDISGAQKIAKGGEAATQISARAQQLADANKTAQMLDKFPRIKALVMIGAKAAAKAGAEVGAQTYVKTGGDTDAALTAGGEAAAAGGVGAPLLTAAGKGAGLLAEKLRTPEPAATADLVSKLDDVLGSVGPAANREATGAAVGKTVDKLKDVAAEHASAAYNPLKAPLGLPENATRAEILAAAEKAAEPTQSTLLDASGKPTTTPGDGGKALADLRKADQAYGASKEVTDRTLVQKIANSNRPELAHDYIAKASLDDMRNLLPKLDEPTRAAVARNVMEDVIARGGEPESYNANYALTALRRLDKDGPKAAMLFGDENAAALKKSLQDIAAVTQTPSGRTAFSQGIETIGHYVGGIAGGAAGGFGGHAVGSVGGRAIMRAVVGNPKIAQNLLFAIESGARPEKYGPMIGAMITQANTQDAEQSAK